MAVEDRILLVGDPFEQIAVMGDHDQGSRPGVEQILSGREHVDVHIIGGLVEHEHVRLVEKGQHQLEATTLTAGQITDPCRELVTAEAEAFQQLCRVSSLPSTSYPAFRRPTTSRTRSSASSASRPDCWSSIASRTVLPRLTRPLSG